jgi:hypothetical protein
MRQRPMTLAKSHHRALRKACLCECLNPHCEEMLSRVRSFEGSITRLLIDFPRGTRYPRAPERNLISQSQESHVFHARTLHARRPGRQIARNHFS